MDPFSIIQKYSFLTLGEEEGKYEKKRGSIGDTSFLCVLAACLPSLCLPSLAPEHILLGCLWPVW